MKDVEKEIKNLVPNFNQINAEYEDKSTPILFASLRANNKQAYEFFRRKRYSNGILTEKQEAERASFGFYRLIDRITIIDFLLLKRPTQELKDFHSYLEQRLNLISDENARKKAIDEIKLMDDYIALAEQG